MLSFHAHRKIFLATGPCDLRMNFNGLWSAAQEKLGREGQPIDWAVQTHSHFPQTRRAAVESNELSSRHGTQVIAHKRVCSYDSPRHADFF